VQHPRARTGRQQRGRIEVLAEARQRRARLAQLPADLGVARGARAGRVVGGSGVELQFRAHAAQLDGAAARSPAAPHDVGARLGGGLRREHHLTRLGPSVLLRSIRPAPDQRRQAGGDEEGAP
jgi:hypothetical protein